MCVNREFDSSNRRPCRARQPEHEVELTPLQLRVSCKLAAVYSDKTRLAEISYSVEHVIASSHSYLKVRTALPSSRAVYDTADEFGLPTARRTWFDIESTHRGRDPANSDESHTDFSGEYGYNCR